jgi:nucleotide-binding universal stress UspA family protein
MFGTFLVMAAIEVSLFIDKPHARVFAVTILAAGLVLRGLAAERAARKKAVSVSPQAESPPHSYAASPIDSRDPLLCAVGRIGRTLDFAIEEARETARPLYVLFVREQAVVTSDDRERKWQADSDATSIFHYLESKSSGIRTIPCYAVSDAVADTIVDLAATLGVSRLILGSPQRSSLVNLLRGNIIRDVSNLLPDNIHLVVYA